MTPRLTLLLLIGVTACQPQPRSATYFKAHPDEAIRTDAQCRTGARRGDECDAALAGVSQATREARSAMFRRGFEK